MGVEVMVSYKEQCQFANEEFGRGIKDSFRELLGSSTLSDVTLVSEDEEHVEAHRVILASSSTFFRNILCKIKHPQTFIYLKGVKKNELKHIIEFIYTGEATIAKDQLGTFLESARSLKINGLEKRNDVKFENTETNLQIPVQDTQLFSNVETLNLPDEHPFYVLKDIVESQAIAESDKTISNLGQQIMDGITKVDGVWVCTYCSKTFKSRTRASEHVEVHLEGFSHSCSICNKSTKTTKALKKHIERVHSYKYSTYLQIINNQ